MKAELEDDILLSGTYDFQSLYKSFVKKHKGLKYAKKYALDWLESESKFPKVNLSPNIRRYKNRLESGKVYNFRYDPKTKDQLSYYDRNPLILSLGPSKKYKNLDLAINLNFLPPKYKLLLLDTAYKFQRGKIKRSRRIYHRKIKKGLTPNPIRDEFSSKFWYHAVKRIVPNELSWAIRSYYVQRRSKTVVISYNRWPEVAVLEISDMEGITLSQVYRLWRKLQKKR